MYTIKADNLTSIKVRSADTDVIVILFAFMPQFRLWNNHIRIWCDFGTGVNRKAIYINSMKDCFICNLVAISYWFNFIICLMVCG